MVTYIRKNINFFFKNQKSYTINGLDFQLLERYFSVYNCIIYRWCILYFCRKSQGMCFCFNFCGSSEFIFFSFYWKLLMVRSWLFTLELCKWFAFWWDESKAHLTKLITELISLAYMWTVRSNHAHTWITRLSY